MPSVITNRRVTITSVSTASVFVSQYSMLHDGVNEYINIPHNAAFNFSITDACSFSFWIKRTAISGNIEMVITKNIGIIGYWIMVRNINLLSFATGNNNIVIDSTTPIDNTTSWYNAICTYDGSQNANGMNWYVNNGAAEKIITVNNPPGNIETLAPLKLGVWGDNSLPFGGNKNNVSIWNKELTASDRTGIWNNGTPGNLIIHPSNGNLIYWEDVDNAIFNGADWSVPDSSQNNNVGTSVNMEEADRVLDAP